MEGVPDDFWENYLDSVHGGLDVQILERQTKYRKARTVGVTHIFIELNV